MRENYWSKKSQLEFCKTEDWVIYLDKRSSELQTLRCTVIKMAKAKNRIPKANLCLQRPQSCKATKSRVPGCRIGWVATQGHQNVASQDRHPNSPREERKMGRNNASFNFQYKVCWVGSISGPSWLRDFALNSILVLLPLDRIKLSLSTRQTIVHNRRYVFKGHVQVQFQCPINISRECYIYNIICILYIFFVYI